MKLAPPELPLERVHHADLTETPSPALDLASFLALAHRSWRFVLAIAFLLGVITFALTLGMQRRFTTHAMILPDTKTVGGLSAALTGMASQFGLQLGEGMGTKSPRLYADLATSRTILERMLATPVSSTQAGPRRPLIDWVVAPRTDSLDRLEQGVRRLAKAISVRTDLQTGVVRVDVVAKDPLVAANAANALLQYFGEFNLHQRQTQGHERRAFVEKRMTSAVGDLNASEESVRFFLERNRSYQSSPQLVYEFGRLQRQLELRQQVYLTLARELETARIEELNDTPLFTIVDSARAPVKPSSPRRFFLTVSGAVLGFVAAAFLVIVIENLRRRAADGDAEARRMHDRWRAAMRRVPSVVRPR
jgi:uncharacterized protein involved in exopolysaccharide biosynthesis